MANEKVEACDEVEQRFSSPHQFTYRGCSSLCRDRRISKALFVARPLRTTDWSTSTSMALRFGLNYPRIAVRPT